MSRPSKLTLLIACALLVGCGNVGPWSTSYSDVVSRAASSSWGAGNVTVTVPRSLSVSEANAFAPSADIVWQEEAEGDRHEQVRAIVAAGAKRANRKLGNGRPVTISIKVKEFHALTKRARYNAPGGVHNITLEAQVFDELTGQALTPPDLIRADLLAFTGAEAAAVETRGYTQKYRITQHIDKVISGWLGVGPDPRGVFSELGR